MASQPGDPGIPIIVKGKNVEVSPELRQYALKKTRKLDRYFNSYGAARAEVAVAQLRGQYEVEVTLQLGGVFLRGAGRASDLQAAVDEAVDRAERQFLRFKSKVDSKHQQGPRGAEPAHPQTPGPGTPGEGQEGNQPRVVRVKRFDLKPMPVEEAIDQMEMLGHDFFVFTNSATRQVNVLYRRRDGNYGLIEPGP